MKITIENPVDWFKDPPIAKYLKPFYKNLISSCKDHFKDIEFVDVFYQKKMPYNRTPEFNFLDTIYISYHTYGDIVPNLFRIKESYLPGFFSIDPKGFSGFSKFSDENLDEQFKIINYTNAKNFVESIKNNLIKTNTSKYSQNEFVNSDIIPNNSIFFPLQIESDVVLKLSNFNFYDIIDTVCENISRPIIIKLHPLSIDNKILEKKIKDIVLKHKNVTITDLSIHQILPSCDCCITINSGVGFESLLHNKPTINFGKSDYCHVSYYCDTKEKINDNLINCCISNHNKENNTKFLYYYLNNYCFYYTDILQWKDKNGFMALGKVE